MVADGQKVEYPHLSQTEISSLSPEEKRALEQKRRSAETELRNQRLTDSISGSSGNYEKLQAEYNRVKAEKGQLQAGFNELHAGILSDLHPNYYNALENRRKAGFAKLNKQGIFDTSKAMFNKYTAASENLRRTGDLGGINIGTTSITNPERLTSYVSGQQDFYSKQYRTDSENYELAVTDFNNANRATSEADRALTDAIDKERGLVADMRLKDEQMRNISIAQGYLA